MRKGFGLGLAALLLAVAGCGEKKAGGRGGLTVSTEDLSGAIGRLNAEENARSRVTLIDAATGDASAMPEEWTGPTAYDLRGTGPAETDEAGEADAPARQPAPAPGPALTLVPEELFPSVAE